MIQRRNAWHSAGLRRDRVPPSTAGAPPPGWEHYLLKGGWVGNLAGRIGCRPKLPKALPTVADLKALMPPSKKRRAGRGLGTGAGGGDASDDEDEGEEAEGVEGGDDQHEEEDGVGGEEGEEGGEEEEEDEQVVADKAAFNASFSASMEQKGLAVELGRSTRSIAMRRSALVHALDVGAVKQRKRRAEDDGDDGDDAAEPATLYDLTAKAKAAMNDDMVSTVSVKEALDAQQAQVYALRLELAHARGQKLTGRFGTHVFQRKAACTTAAERRSMDRTMSRAEAPLTALWEMTDHDDEGTDGLEAMMAQLLLDGLDGSGAHWTRRWVRTKKVVALLYESPLMRALIERQRARVKIWSPSCINARLRSFHVGQQQLRGMRVFACRQLYGNAILLSAKREAIAYVRLWFPQSTQGFGELIELEDESEREACLEAAARRAVARAKQAQENEEREALLLRTEAEKEAALLTAGADAASPITASWDLGGFALAEQHEEDGGRTAVLIVEVLKLAHAHGRWLPTLFRRLLDATPCATEYHLLVQHLDKYANGPYQHTAAAITGYEALAFRDRPATVAALPGIEPLDAIDKHGRTRRNVPIQRYLVVSRDALKRALSHCYRINDISGVHWVISHDAAAARRLHVAAGAADDVEPHWYETAAIDASVARHQGTDGATVEEVLPDASLPPICIYGLLPPGLVASQATSPAEVVGGGEDDEDEEDEETRTAKAARSAEQKKASKYVCSHLQDGLGLALLGRQMNHVPLPDSNAASIGYVLSLDKGEVNGGLRQNKEQTVVLAIPKCWGAKEDWWGKAGVTHAMRNANSADYAVPLANWNGDDHAANQREVLRPLVDMAEDLRKNKLIPDHGFLPLPPKLLRADGSVAKDLSGKGFDDRRATVRQPIYDVKMCINADLGATMEMCGLSWRNETATSPFHNRLHLEQSRLGAVVEVPRGLSVRDIIKREWGEGNTAIVMTQITLMMADRSIDWSCTVMRPAEEPAPAGEKAKRGSAPRVPTASGAATTAAARAAPKSAPRAKMQWASAELRTRRFKLEAFRSELVIGPDADADAALDAVADHVRLVLMPTIPQFGERTLESTTVDAEVLNKYLALCVLHAEMRQSELVCEMVEGKLRGLVESRGAGQAWLTHFNTALRDMKLRHKIALNAEATTSGSSSKCYKTALDGGDASTLRDDWILLEHDDLDGDGRTTKFSSVYFRAVQTALVNCGDDVEEELDRLVERARAVRHYAKAMSLARRTPDAMKLNGIDATHDAFEKESRLFCVCWIAAGLKFTGYGWHMWTSLPVLFRRWGCLESICQTPVEGMIQKVGRIIGHVSLSPGGNYSQETRQGGPEAIARELERRRAHLKAPAQALGEELAMEFVEGEYQYLPAKKGKVAWELKRVMIRVDADIAAEATMSYKDWCAYWVRWMETSRAVVKVRAVLLKRRARRAGETLRVLPQSEAARRPRGAEEEKTQYLVRTRRFHRGPLWEEWRSYYSVFPVDDRDDDLRKTHKQRERKRDWREKRRSEKRAGATRRAPPRPR
jgi:hypothetical protein